MASENKKMAYFDSTPVQLVSAEMGRMARSCRVSVRVETLFSRGTAYKVKKCTICDFIASRRKVHESCSQPRTLFMCVLNIIVKDE